ncbi:unnamed protein product (macronuclear) [Paramecium tetraurelia]|uniref:RAVE complex protein Rav1 C-terminal domain-containing protein n=1 Tax=Paramecium tetraurelia TaxID=5888 RepID=A0D532_PARTE|nr:uncharacterized protein GSPATT00013596001 [Paramecium tetraurelia]CAK78149.1 unnamed protein product [Paramecium tetraurelia]|eukprot:XP_001445546.1 hypothetical protein (macronuclear) [Paramecium tetraurelia strain d4-2]
MYQILKSVSHFQNECILTYSKEKLIIYTKEILLHMQTFRNYISDIVAVATSSKGVFVVFCERELIAYKPLLNGWEQGYSKNCTNPIRDAFFSFDDEHIIGCSQNKLHIWKATHKQNRLLGQLDQYELIDLTEIYTLELEYQIANVKFSPDVRYFTTLHLNTVIVWDFHSIKEVQEGALSQQQRVSLDHQDEVISYKFRGTLRIAPSPFPTPNTIVTLTKSNQLTIWQEMIQCKNFCKLHTLHFDQISSFCFIYLKGLTPYPWKNTYLESDQFGVQDTEQSSVDYLLLHQESELSVVKLDFLRNYSLEESVKVIKKTKSNIFNQIKKILLVDQIEGQKIEMIGFDRLWNLIKICVNLKDDSQQMFQCEKFIFQNIVHFSTCKSQVAIINDWNYLCLQQLKLNSVISQEYHIVEGQQKIWKINSDLSKYQLMFIAKDKIKENDVIVLTSSNAQQCQAFIIQQNQLVEVHLKLYNHLSNEYRDKITDLRKINYEIDDLQLLVIAASKIALIQIQFEIYGHGQMDLQILELKTWKLDFTYERLQVLQSIELSFISISGKTLKGYNEQMKQIVQISKNYNIKDVGQLKGIQPIYYVMSHQNEIDFHSSSGEFLVRFNLQSFLVRVDKALYDVSKVIVQVVPLNNFAFILQTDNYLTAFAIQFDKSDQNYKLTSIKQKYLNNREAIYCKRLSKYSMPQNYRFFTIKDCLIVKTGRKVKVLGNSLIRCLADKFWMPSTLSYKLINQQNNVQLQDYDFLSELIQLGKIQLVQFILKLICLKFKHHGTLGNHFMVPYKYLLELYHLNSEPEPLWVDAIKTYVTKKLQDKDSYDYTLHPVDVLKKICQEYPLKITIILDYLRYYEDNSRSLDFYAAMFMFHVQIFRNQPTHKRNRVLSSKEVVWALHSLQKETLWQECIGNSDDLSWNLVKRYAAVLWMDLSFIKQRLEEIALQIYKQSKDPFQSLLYFIVLGKKSVITTLFKKEVNSGKEYKSTYEFLQQDFTQPRWKSAASKNAYALVSKKRYQDAAAFFLIGGHLNDAVNVMARYMEDIQLAYLTTKIHEPQGGPVGEQLIQDYFIKSGEEMNDIWLLHIGFYLLGRYVDSVNVLLREPEHHILEYDNSGKAVCISWPSTFTPQLSYYHPSAILLVEKLKENINVKREIQQSIDANKKKSKKAEDDIFSQFYESEESEEEEVVEQVPIKKINDNQEFIKQQAVEYYYNIQMPQLGMIFAQELNQQTEQSEQLIELQIEMYIVQAIEDQEHFTNYVQLMQKLDDLANFTNHNKTKLYDIALKKLRQLKSPSRFLTFAIHYDQTGLDEFISFCQETQSLLYRICFDYPLSEKSQEYYLTFVQSLYEIDVGLKLFQQSQYYQKKFDNKLKLNIIKLLALFMTLILALELHLWENAFEQLRKLETFCNTVYKQHVQDCGYENLRDDFCELVKSAIKNKRLYANKGFKAYRNLDVLQDAYPEDLYNVSEQDYLQKHKPAAPEQEQQKSDSLEDLQQSDLSQEKTTEEENIQNSFIYFTLQSLIVKYFLSISKSYFKLEIFNIAITSYSNIFTMAEQYVTTRNDMVITLLKNLSDFSQEQNFIEDLRMVLKETSFAKSQYFKQLERIFNLNHFFQICQKVGLDQYLEEISINRTKQAFKYPISNFDEQSIITFKNKIFKQGVEVFKIKSDQIKSICINNTNPIEGFVLYGKFLKHMKFYNTLQHKNRSLDGYNLVEEETIDEAIRTEASQTNKPYIVKLCSSALGIQVGLDKEKKSYLKSRAHPYEEYKDFTEKDFMEKFQNCSSKLIPEEDLQCLASHPHLPLFLQGGKGMINVMTFKSSTQVVAEFNSQQRDSIDFLKFNNSGELFIGHDINNSAYIWKLNRVNKLNTPLFQLNSKVRPTTDLTFINEGTVFASIYSSTNKPHFGLYDMLLPSNRNIVAQENFNGTDILFSTPLNSILIGNQKKGTVNFLDIRKNQIYKTLELPFTEIKFMKLNQYQTSLICACNDGQIKIINLETLSTIVDYKPFRQDKKQQIMALTQTENATYAASSDGVISLVYLNA